MEIIEPKLDTNSPPRQSRKGLVIILVSAVILGIVACGGLIGTWVYEIVQVRTPAETILNTFMQDMSAREIQQAYNLFSTRAHNTLQLDDLRQALGSGGAAYFSGYRSLEIQQLNILPRFSNNPDTPQGLVAQISGMFSYQYGYTATFRAVLEKEAGEWRLFEFKFIQAPDKPELRERENIG